MNGLKSVTSSIRPDAAPAWSVTLRRAGLLALPVLLVWAFWPTLVSLYKDWQNDDNYSVGQLVPLVALYLLWQDRRRLAVCPIRASGWGLVLILLAQAARAYGLLFLFESAERYAFVLTIAGLVLLVGGGELFRRTAWILLFLLLMVPLPGRVHNLISAPLQDLSSIGAVATLELLGASVIREGHVMVLNDTTRVAVAEACSGLRMLTAFVVVAATVAFLVKRPSWQKAVLLLSSVPIAILCNLIRLVATALLYVHVGGEWAERFFHDFAGWAMMPLAVVILAAELRIMEHLVTPDPNLGPNNHARPVT